MQTSIPVSLQPRIILHLTSTTCVPSVIVVKRRYFDRLLFSLQGREGDKKKGVIVGKGLETCFREHERTKALSKLHQKKKEQSIKSSTKLTIPYQTRVFLVWHAEVIS